MLLQWGKLVSVQPLCLRVLADNFLLAASLEELLLGGDLSMSVSHPDRLKAEIDELVPDLIATRRDFHEHPELAFEEVRTSGIVAQRLHALGLEVQTGLAKTGVVGLLRGGASHSGAKTIALRADMDALPIHELNDIEYRSQVD